MKKSDTHAFVNQVLVYLLVMIGFTGSVGFSTVWLRHQISLTANNTKQIDQRVLDTERRLAELGAAITAEQTIDVLTRRNNEWQLGLVLPREPQVVRVNENVEQRLAARRNVEVFASDSLVVTPVRFQVGSPRR